MFNCRNNKLVFGRKNSLHILFLNFLISSIFFSNNGFSKVFLLSLRSGLLRITNCVKRCIPFEKKAKNGKAKKEVIAVNNVTFEVYEGEIFGVLGPNGSGKSTLIRLMATLLLPDEGNLKIFGYDVVKDALKVQSLINRVSVEASFFKKLVHIVIRHLVMPPHFGLVVLGQLVSWSLVIGH